MNGFTKSLLWAGGGLFGGYLLGDAVSSPSIDEPVKEVSKGDGIIRATDRGNGATKGGQTLAGTAKGKAVTPRDAIFSRIDNMTMAEAEKALLEVERPREMAHVQALLDVVAKTDPARAIELLDSLPFGEKIEIRMGDRHYWIMGKDHMETNVYRIWAKQDSIAAMNHAFGRFNENPFEPSFSRPGKYSSIMAPIFAEMEPMQALRLGGELGLANYPSVFAPIIARLDMNQAVDYAMGLEIKAERAQALNMILNEKKDAQSKKEFLLALPPETRVGSPQMLGYQHQFGGRDLMDVYLHLSPGELEFSESEWKSQYNGVSSWAARNPVEALRWADENGGEKRDSIRANMISGVAAADVGLALEAWSTLPEDLQEKTRERIYKRWQAKEPAAAEEWKSTWMKEAPESMEDGSLPTIDAAEYIESINPN